MIGYRATVVATRCSSILITDTGETEAQKKQAFDVSLW